MRYTFTLFFTVLSLALSAQLQKGDLVYTLQEPIGVIGFTQNNLTDDNFARLQYLGGNLENTTLSIRPTFGYAFSDRLLGGATLGVFNRSYANFGSDGAAIQLSPYLRYYAVNTSELGIFGQITSPLTYVDKETDVFSSVRIDAGLQLPLIDNVRVGPTLAYLVQSGRNLATLGARMEVVFGRNTRSKEAPTASFGKGSYMVGGQSASLYLNKNGFGGNLTVGGFRFLTDRLAVGASLGILGDRYSFSFSNRSDRVFTSTTYVLGVGGRYYLGRPRRLMWYAEVGTGYIGTGSNDRIDGVNNRQGIGGFYLAAGPGAQYFLRDNIALEMSPQVQTYFFEGNMTLGLSVPVGVRVFF
jgi:hypothetical protein